MIKKHILLIFSLLITLVLSSCTNRPIVTESVEDNALRLINELNAGNYDNAYRNFQFERKLKFSLSGRVFNNLWSDLINDYGNPVEILRRDSHTEAQRTTVSFIVQHEKEQIIINVIYDMNNSIMGLEYGVVEGNIDDTDLSDLGGRTIADNETLLTVGTEEFPLTGLLSVPRDSEGPFPLVILVPGSGPNDMDETIGVCTPFKDLADQLNRLGIAVLRYNNRAYEYLADIGSDIQNFTPYEEIIQDAVAVFQDALTLAEIDPANIFIAGHSIAGYFIPKIAEYTENSAGYIMMAANAYNLEDLIYQQYRYIMNLDGKISFAEKFILARYQNMTKRVRNLKEGDNVNPRKIYGVYPAYWLYANKYDVINLVKNIDVPVLFLQGTRDYQVSVENYRIWEETMANHEKASFILYENLNHLFMYGDTRSTPEEYNIKKTVDTKVGEDISKWVKENIR